MGPIASRIDRNLFIIQKLASTEPIFILGLRISEQHFQVHYKTSEVPMRSILSLLFLTMVLTGCDSTPPPAKLPVGAAFEVFTIAATNGPNTTQAVDPTTGEPLFLQSPPIVTTIDVDTVANGVMYATKADGSRIEMNIPCLDIKLTAEGAAKMSAATAAPTGNSIAVVVNGKVISTPNLNSQIRGSFQISCDPNDPNFKSAVDVLTKH